MFISQVHTHTLSLILMIIQTPRQMEIHHVHQSGTHIHSLFNTHDNTDATADVAVDVFCETFVTWYKFVFR